VGGTNVKFISKEEFGRIKGFPIIPGNSHQIVERQKRDPSTERGDGQKSERAEYTG